MCYFEFRTLFRDSAYFLYFYSFFTYFVFLFTFYSFFIHFLFTFCFRTNVGDAITVLILNLYVRTFDNKMNNPMNNKINKVNDGTTNEITTSSVIEQMFDYTSRHNICSNDEFNNCLNKLHLTKIRLKKLEDDLYIVISISKFSKNKHDIRSGDRAFVIGIQNDIHQKVIHQKTIHQEVRTLNTTIDINNAEDSAENNRESNTTGTNTIIG